MKEVKATHVFWHDQAEYHFVCDDCYFAFKHLQWSGSTKVSDWPAHRRRVYRELEKGQLCQWCLTNSYPTERGQNNEGS
jgi:hypothetical protein